MFFNGTISIKQYNRTVRIFEKFTGEKVGNCFNATYIPCAS